MISGKTDVYAILGDPISQALSPIVHNAAFHVNGQDAVFIGCDVKKADIEKAIEGVRALGFAGLAVTMPLKVAIIPFLDEMDAAANALQAVNVVTIHNDVLKGYNTDGEGFVSAAIASGVKIEGENVLIFGAGGAARGISYALLSHKINKLFVCNAFENEADGLLEMLSKNGFRNVEYVPFQPEAVNKVIDKVSFVINATSLGMNNTPSLHVDLIDWKNLPGMKTFADIVHKPLRTEFIKTAEKYNMPTMTGNMMLLYQGALAYKLYTGKEAPIDDMNKAMQEWLLHQEA